MWRETGSDGSGGGFLQVEVIRGTWWGRRSSAVSVCVCVSLKLYLLSGLCNKGHGVFSHALTYLHRPQLKELVSARTFVSLLFSSQLGFRSILHLILSVCFILGVSVQRESLEMIVLHGVVCTGTWETFPPQIMLIRFPTHRFLFVWLFYLPKERKKKPTPKLHSTAKEQALLHLMTLS